MKAKVMADIRKKVRNGIMIRTPQFERDDGKQVGKAPPIPWERLAKCSLRELREMGLVAWDDALMLIPGDWYDSIPDGFVMEAINGDRVVFKRGKTNDDIRFGMLAYGIRVRSSR